MTDPLTTFTAAEVAARKGCHSRTVRLAIKRGEFPGAYRNIEGQRAEWRIPLAEAEAWQPLQKGRPKGKRNE